MINMVLRQTDSGRYEIYNLGNNILLAAFAFGQVGTELSAAFPAATPAT
jgi:hypothetical protein